MADGAADVETLLGKMAKPAGAGYVPLRDALALPLRRAAEAGARLNLTVSDVAAQSGNLPDLLAEVAASDLLFALHRDGAPVATVVLSQDLVLALVEMQTVGSITGSGDPDHSPTAADSALSEPFVASMLALFGPAVRGTALEGACDGLSRGERLADTRAAELALPKGSYSGVRATCVYGERSGTLLLVLPPAPTTEPDPQTVSSWQSQWSPAVSRIPARLEAVLHRMQVPLSEAEGWQVDQVIPLPGASVGGLRLETSDGRLVTRARLGQCSGHRALRIELPAAPQMDELAGGAASDGMLLDDGMTLDAEPVLDDGGLGEMGDMGGLGEEPAEMGGELGGFGADLPEDDPLTDDLSPDDEPLGEGMDFDAGGFGLDLPEE